MNPHLDEILKNRSKVVCTAAGGGGEFIGNPQRVEVQQKFLIPKIRHVFIAAVTNRH